MGGEVLYRKSGYIMVLKTPQEVADVANVIRPMTEEEFKSRYRKIDQAQCDWDLSEDDCDYSWHWFQVVRDLFQRAAEENRFVLFTASQ